MPIILLETGNGFQVRHRKTGSSFAKDRAASAKNVQFWPFVERASSKRDTTTGQLASFAVLCIVCLAFVGVNPSHITLWPEFLLYHLQH